MKPKSHMFEIEIAEKYGVNEAIILHNMAYWIGKNETDNRMIIDGYCWTYITLKKLQKDYFSYWTWEQIQYIMRKLEKNNIIKKGKYNKIPTDQTTWYTIIDPFLIKYYNLYFDNTLQKNPSHNVKLHIAKCKNTDCNLINSKHKNSKQILSKDSISDFKKSHKKSIKKYNPLNKKLYNLIKDILLINKGLFSTRLPKEENDLISGVLDKVRSYLQDIEKGYFDNINRYSSYRFDQDWIKQNNIKFINVSYENRDDLFKIIKKAIRRYAKMFLLNYWPDNKKWLTKSLADFFYNPMTKKSWFLYCLNNKPKEIRKSNADKNSINIFPKNNKKSAVYLEYCKLFLKEIGKDRWDELIYWKKIKQLWLWYDKYEDALLCYNKGSWQINCGDFIKLLNRIKEFSKTWKNNWSINNFGYDNKTWDLFREWIKKEKGLELKPKNNILLKTIECYENGGRKVRNSDILRKELRK
jgi:hypothetical protein